MSHCGWLQVKKTLGINHHTIKRLVSTSKIFMLLKRKKKREKKLGDSGLAVWPAAKILIEESQDTPDHSKFKSKSRHLIHVAAQKEKAADAEINMYRRGFY